MLPFHWTQKPTWKSGQKAQWEGVFPFRFLAGIISCSLGNLESTYMIAISLYDHFKKVHKNEWEWCSYNILIRINQDISYMIKVTVIIVIKSLISAIFIVSLSFLAARIWPKTTSTTIVTVLINLILITNHPNSFLPSSSKSVTFLLCRPQPKRAPRKKTPSRLDPGLGLQQVDYYLHQKI